MDQIKDISEKIAELRERVNDREQEESENSVLRAENTQLKAQAVTLNATIDAQIQTIAGKNADIAQLNADKAQQQAVIVELQRQLQEQQPEGTSQILAINTHGFIQQAYKNNIPQQGNLMRGMGMNGNRIDIKTLADGTISDMSILYQYLMTGIRLYPMIYTTGMSKSARTTAELNANYQKGFTLFSGVTKILQYVVTHIEIGNEVYFTEFVTPDPSGTSLSQYNVDGLQAIAAYFKGAADGIRSVNPGIKITVNGSWTHFAWIQYLIDYGVQFDTIAWHWYDDMERRRLQATPVPIEDTLVSKFPTFQIIFNEVGGRNEYGTDTEQQTSDKMMPYITRLVNKNYGIFVYELLKQPYLTAPFEQNYGIYRNVTTPTIVVQQLRELIQSRLEAA